MSHAVVAENPIFGLLAEFDKPSDLIEATEKAYAAGYRKMDAYTPFPVEEVSHALGFTHDMVGWIAFGGGICGFVGGFGLECYAAMISYPMNIGGRPLYSWPAFMPIGFECTVLLSALSAVVGMLILNGLPQPYHPVFNAPNFQLASQNRFFLCIESKDPRYDSLKTKEFLAGFHALSVQEVSA